MLEQSVVQTVFYSNDGWEPYRFSGVVRVGFGALWADVVEAIMWDMGYGHFTIPYWGA